MFLESISIKSKELNVYVNDAFTIQSFEDTSKYDIAPDEKIDVIIMLTDYDVSVICETFSDGKKGSNIYAINRCKNSQTRIDKTLRLPANIKRGILGSKLWLKKL